MSYKFLDPCMCSRIWRISEGRSAANIAFPRFPAIRQKEYSTFYDQLFALEHTILAVSYHLRNLLGINYLIAHLTDADWSCRVDP